MPFTSVHMDVIGAGELMIPPRARRVEDKGEKRGVVFTYTATNG